MDLLWKYAPVRDKNGENIHRVAVKTHKMHNLCIGVEEKPDKFPGIDEKFPSVDKRNCGQRGILKE